ncbi:MAG: outer membrane lipoprotein carrier protein LolA, partial [Candidatus Desulfatibia sp.]|uniref:LolA family protein n=1 Tax=Candidatus Desulfatibia sp. TaxID=3101189 RepID=UPI002F3279A4
MKLLKPYFAKLCVVLYIFLCPLQVFSFENNPKPDQELNRVIKNIKEKEKNLKTFTAKFRQTRKTHLLREPLYSEGMIYFDSSGKLLMKVTSPSPLLILFKKNTLLIYYPEISKAEKRYIGNTENIIKKYFGIGRTGEALKKEYEIQLSTKGESDGYYLNMLPKKTAISKHIERIEVLVNPETWLPERIFLTETKGDQSTLWLQFDSINQPLPPGIFSID